jgi:hypothetical protein
MPVFITYRHIDRPHAILIHNRLMQANIRTCLEVLDPESQTTDDISGLITRNVGENSHLLALVSDKSALAWWVPFQLGEATICNRRICTFKTGASELPDYLGKWPRLAKIADIDFFIDAYRNEQTLRRSINLDTDTRNEWLHTSNKTNAERFHNELKARIRRGF